MTAAAVAMTAAATQASKNVRMAAIPLDAPSRNYQPSVPAIKGKTGNCITLSPSRVSANMALTAPPEIKPEGRMDHRWFYALAVAGLVGLPNAVPVAAWAQASGPRSSPGLQQPHLRDDEQI